MKIPAVDPGEFYLKPVNMEGLNNRYMNPGELEVLAALVRSVMPRTVIEFGVNDGRTAKMLLREVHGIKRYVGIDVMAGYVSEKEVQRKEIPAIPGRLAKDDPRFELILRPRGSLDLSFADLPLCDVAFIDGDHGARAVKHDTSLAMDRVRPGGMLIWHDYHDRETVDVRKVLDDYHDHGGWNLKHVTGTWFVFRRIPEL